MLNLYIFIIWSLKKKKKCSIYKQNRTHGQQEEKKGDSEAGQQGYLMQAVCARLLPALHSREHHYLRNREASMLVVIYQQN